MDSIIDNFLIKSLFILRKGALYSVLGGISSRHLYIILVPLITKIGENNIAIKSLF